MLFKPELAINFEVISVHFEPHAESTWILKHPHIDPIKLYDQLFETLKSDELLDEKTVLAQVDIRSAELLELNEKKNQSFNRGTL